MLTLRASGWHALSEILIAFLVMAVILTVVWIVVRAVMGKRFRSPEIPSGTLWWSYERQLMRRMKHDQTPEADDKAPEVKSD